MTFDVLTGLVVLHVRLTVQLLAPAAIVQDEGESVRVPVMGARHVVPFHVVPDTQLAVAVRLASSCWLLYRKKVRPLGGTIAAVVPLLPVATVVFALG